MPKENASAVKGQLLPALRRRIHCPLDRPFTGATQPRPQHFFRHARFAGQFGQRVIPPAIVKPNVGDAIIGLLAFCRPAAVARLVVAVVVRPPVNRIAPVWSLAHVRQEALEPAYASLANAPTITHCNGPLLVVPEGRVRRLGTPGDHALPRRVRGRHLADNAVAVFATLAPTRLWSRTADRITGQFPHPPANTPAEPHGCLGPRFPARPGPLDDRPIPDGSANHFLVTSTRLRPSGAYLLCRQRHLHTALTLTYPRRSCRPVLLDRAVGPNHQPKTVLGTALNTRTSHTVKPLTISATVA